MNSQTLNKKSLLKKIAQKYSLELILLFGSRVSKKIHQESDFDVAYLSKRELSGKEEIELDCDLMEVFESEKVDLVNLRKVDPLLRYEIAENCQLLYGKEEDLLEFKAFAFRDYINHLPLLELEDFLIKKRQKLLKKLIYGK